MRACFHPDSHVRVSWFRGNGADFVQGSIDMARRNVLAKHRLSPIRVVLSGNRAVASMPAIVEIPRGRKGIEMTSIEAIRASFTGPSGVTINGASSASTPIYLRDELTPAIPGHSISIDPHELQSFRPAYRLLSYILSKEGYTVDTELPGDDRPESIRALMRGVFTWAG